MVTETGEGLSLVLTRRAELLAAVTEHRRVLEHWRSLALVTLAGAAIYGAVLGSWRDAQLGLYDALKLPLVLGLTVLFTMPFHWMIARLLGATLGLAQVGALTALSLAIGSVLLASLSPIAALFTACSPPPSARAVETYDLLYVVHCVVVGASCFAGTLSLWRTLRQVCGGAAATGGIYVAWLAVDALVGGEVAWAMRPFIGSLYLPIAFLRPDAFQGNVFEAFVHALTGLLSTPH